MRFFFTALTLAAIPATVLGAVFNVTVGANGQLAYNPSNITANTGDQINFMFQAKNHSVTQSSFTSPCTRAVFNNTPGVNSGFLAIPPNSTISNGTTPMWSITISNTSPLWFHCAQTVPVSHCQRGMVFSINATPQKSFAAFQATAMASGANTTSASGASTTNASGSNATSASGAAASGAGTPAAQAASNTSGTSGPLSTRGAVGLLTIVTIGAMFF